MFISGLQPLEYQSVNTLQMFGMNLLVIFSQELADFNFQRHRLATVISFFTYTHVIVNLHYQTRSDKLISEVFLSHICHRSFPPHKNLGQRKKNIYAPLASPNLNPDKVGQLKSSSL